MAYLKKMIWLIVGASALKGATVQLPAGLQAVVARYANARKMLQAYDADLRAIILDWNPEAQDLRVPASAEVTRRFQINHPDFGGMADPTSWGEVQKRWVEQALLASYLEAHQPIIDDACHQLAQADANGPDVLIARNDFNKESEASWGLVESAFENTIETLEYFVSEAKTLVDRTAYPWFARMFVPITMPLRPTVRKNPNGGTSNFPPPVAQLSYVQNNQPADVIAQMRAYLKKRVPILEAILADMLVPLPVPATPEKAPTPEPMVQQKPTTENPEEEYLETPEPPEAENNAAQELEEPSDPRVDAGMDREWVEGMRKRIAVIKKFANE